MKAQKQTSINNKSNKKVPQQVKLLASPPTKFSLYQTPRTRSLSKSKKMVSPKVSIEQKINKEYYSQVQKQQQQQLKHQSQQKMHSQSLNQVTPQRSSFAHPAQVRVNLETSPNQDTEEDQEQDIVNLEIKIRQERIQTANDLMDDEKDRRVQELQGNNVNNKLKKMIIQKTHQFIIEEIEQIAQNSVDNSINSATAVKYANQDMDGSRNNMSNSNYNNGATGNVQLFDKNQNNENQKTPSRQRTKSGSQSKQNLEDKIQRFEDLNRLAFFKSYLDHVKQIKIAQNQCSFKLDNTASLAKLHRETCEDQEQERCPPVEMLQSKCDESPLSSQQKQFLFPMTDEVIKEQEQESVKIEIQEVQKQQQQYQEVQAVRESVQSAKLKNIVQKEAQIKLQSQKSTKVSEKRKNTQNSYQTIQNDSLGSKSVYQTTEKPKHQKETSQTRPNLMSPIRASQNSQLNENQSNYKRKLITTYQSKTIHSTSCTPKNQDNLIIQNHNSLSQKRDDIIQNLKSLHNTNQVLSQDKVANHSFRKRNSMSNISQQENSHNQSENHKSIQSIEQVVNIINVDPNTNDITLNGQEMNQLVNNRVEITGDRGDITLNKPVFYTNSDHNEISKLKISERDVESEDSSNMHDLVQELNSLSHEIHNHLRNSESTQKQGDSNRNQNQMHQEISHQQDYQNLIDKTCEILLQRFQEMVDKHQDLRQLVQDAHAQTLGNNSTAQMNIQAPNIDNANQNDKFRVKKSMIIDESDQETTENQETQKSGGTNQQLFSNNFSENSYHKSQCEQKYELKSPNPQNRNNRQNNLSRHRSQAALEDEDEDLVEQKELQSKQQSLYSSNEKRSLLQSAKSQSSPKTQQNNAKELNNRFSNPKTLYRNTNGYDIFNDDLKIVVEASKDDCNMYNMLVSEFEQSLKPINVKLLQIFRGKRNPDQYEVKQGQALLMLLSGVDLNIMITNDKCNVVQKTWRNFQDYLSSVGLIKSLGVIVQSNPENQGNQIVQNFLQSAYQFAYYIYSLLDSGLIQTKSPNQGDKKRAASKSQKRDVSNNRNLSPTKNFQEQSVDDQNGLRLTRMNMNNKSRGQLQDTIERQSPQRQQRGTEIARQSAKIVENQEKQQVKQPLKNNQYSQQQPAQSLTPMKDPRRLSNKASLIEQTEISRNKNMKIVSSSQNHVNEATKEKQRLKEMELKVAELSKERDVLRRQIEKEEKQKLKEHESKNQTQNESNQMEDKNLFENNFESIPKQPIFDQKKSQSHHYQSEEKTGLYPQVLESNSSLQLKQQYEFQLQQLQQYQQLQMLQQQLYQQQQLQQQAQPQQQLHQQQPQVQQQQLYTSQREKFKRIENLSQEKVLIDEIDKQIQDFQNMKKALMNQQQNEVNNLSQSQSKTKDQSDIQLNLRSAVGSGISAGMGMVSSTVDSFSSQSKMKEVSGRMRNLQLQEEEIKRQLAQFNNTKRHNEL
ncbi:UNKNOWN [Stylonychia lemnae]|uniref:Uncharacterized protein n=1 Tax=Stylonychia lemnae TaxID=5949 RepID=A0A078ATW2_STYLE|nr:UNKNOWN [Stylonychia lemnae]|eukprot:CDW84677.1 UNKNOWN [Stylonychia lemnae]